MTSYEYGDKLTNYIADYLNANGVKAVALRVIPDDVTSAWVNQASGDVISFIRVGDIFDECKRNGAISKSSIENFRGYNYIISEQGVLRNPERIHVIPRRVINSYVSTIVYGDPKRNIKAQGWSKLPRSGDQGIILTNKKIKDIRAGRTLSQYAEELRGR